MNSAPYIFRTVEAREKAVRVLKQLIDNVERCTSSHELPSLEALLHNASTEIHKMARNQYAREIADSE